MRKSTIFAGLLTLSLIGATGALAQSQGGGMGGGGGMGAGGGWAPAV